MCRNLCNFNITSINTVETKTAAYPLTLHKLHKQFTIGFCNNAVYSSGIEKWLDDRLNKYMYYLFTFPSCQVQTTVKVMYIKRDQGTHVQRPEWISY